MKGSRFHTILEYRKNIEEQIHLEFFALKKKGAKENEKLVSIKNKITDLYQLLQKKQRENISAAVIELHQKFLYALNKEEEKQKGIIKDLESILEEKRLQLLEASKEKKIMEKYKERALGKLYKEQLKEEQKALDEKAINQHNLLEKTIS